MKLIFCIAIAGLLTSATFADDTKPDYHGAIVDVTASFHYALTNSIGWRKPTLAEANADKQAGHAPKLRPVLLEKKFVGLLTGVDTSGCPDDFKTAWRGFVTTLTLDGHATLSEIGDTISANPLHAVGDLAKIADKKNEVKKEKSEAWLQLRLCASSYGVTNWFPHSVASAH